MRVELKLRTAILILGVVLATVAAGSAVAAELTADDRPYDHRSEIVYLEDGSEIWPYTSASRAFESRTLAINLVVYGQPGVTEFVLRDAPHGEWRDVEEGREDIAPVEGEDELFNETVIGFGAADGANRYMWANPVDEDPTWLAEAYQLEDGDYLGHRHHLRAYTPSSGAPWTAVQVHSEHWDWFHLRHTVHTVEQSQLVVEEEFQDRAYVMDLRRQRFGNDQGLDANGWATLIDLDDNLFPVVLELMLLAGVGVATRNRANELGATMREDPAFAIGIRALAVALSIVLTYHVVRFGSIGVERHAPEIPLLAVWLLFFPVLVIGLPVVAYLTARPLDATVAFAAATIGFLVAIFLDYSYLGVVQIPLETIVHRGALGVGIGMIAAGASETARLPNARRGYVRTGVLLWVGAVAVPLAQFL